MLYVCVEECMIQEGKSHIPGMYTHTHVHKHALCELHQEF